MVSDKQKFKIDFKTLKIKNADKTRTPTEAIAIREEESSLQSLGPDEIFANKQQSERDGSKRNLLGSQRNLYSMGIP